MSSALQLLTFDIFGAPSITTLQTYFYYLHYAVDYLTVKGLVAFVRVIDTTHSALMCHLMYQYLVRCCPFRSREKIRRPRAQIVAHGHPEIREFGTWSLFASIVFDVSRMSKTDRITPRFSSLLIKLSESSFLKASLRYEFI
ncbi:hypothetical protein GYMLUDRAFT_41451, partial [Collybiopsis luxurians FD-317 M1]